MVLPHEKSNLRVCGFCFVSVKPLYCTNDLSMGLFTLIIDFCTCFNCSSKPLHRVEGTIGRKFSPLKNSPLATTMGLRSYRSCLKTYLPRLYCCCLPNSALSSLQNTFSRFSKGFLSFLSISDQQILPNRYSFLPKTTRLVQFTFF